MFNKLIIYKITSVFLIVVFLISTAGCQPPSTDSGSSSSSSEEIVTSKSTTDSNGTANFLLTTEDEEIYLNVDVIDNNDDPAVGVTVDVAVVDDYIFCHVYDPNESYYPSTTRVPKNSSKDLTNRVLGTVDSSYNGTLKSIEARGVGLTISALALITLYISGQIIPVIMQNQGFNSFPNYDGLSKETQTGDLTELAQFIATTNIASVVHVSSEVAADLNINNGEYFDIGLPPENLNSTEISTAMTGANIDDDTNYRWGYYTNNGGIVSAMGIYLLEVTGAAIDDPIYDLSGSWNGEWTNGSSGGTGNLSMSLNMTADGVLAGTMTDEAVGLTLDIESGTVEGSNVQIEVYYSGAADNIIFTGEAVVANYMNGTWDLGQNGSEFGTWYLSK